ncbi:hypothetical protein MERGE_000200 [Pneumocystis wakefieldiae]|uniref:Cytochrome c oxidase assembly protein CtaG n=1 Tax=Pneumocystis wakefieldiae TaxID=38082 RepID=A0A899FUS2_9ASCO|nr:hypothetical protein MERGE_000200 [Pneumocystis wakefieldiae]
MPIYFFNGGRWYARKWDGVFSISLKNLIYALAGTPIIDSSKFTPDRMIPVHDSERIRITFNADVSDSLEWDFAPLQKEIYVLPGETALAFYTVHNKSDKDIIGISTYSVTPVQTAPYFSKIACFCYEGMKILKKGESNKLKSKNSMRGNQLICRNPLYTTIKEKPIS